MNEKNLLDIRIIGNLNCDMLGRVTHMPEADEEVALETLENFLGGSGANLAVVAARLGMRVALFSAVGDDKQGVSLVKMLDEQGVSSEHVKRVPGKRSGMVFGVVEPDGERRLFSYRGANSELKAEDITDEELSTAKRIHLSSPAYDLALDVLKRARALGLATSMDPGSALINAQNIGELLPMSDILFVNEVEFKKLSQGVNYLERAEDLHSKGADWILLKHQEQGSALFRPGQPPLTQNAFDIQAVDTTGSGDAFDAAFLYAVMQDYEMGEALRVANAAGAMNALLPGAVTGVPEGIGAMEAFMRRTSLRGEGIDY